MSFEGPSPIESLPEEILQKEILVHFSTIKTAVPCVSNYWQRLHNQNQLDVWIKVKTQSFSLQQIKEFIFSQPLVLERLTPLCSQFDFIADILEFGETRMENENFRERNPYVAQRNGETSAEQQFLQLGREYLTIAENIIANKAERKIFSLDDLASLGEAHPSLIPILYRDKQLKWKFKHLFAFAKKNLDVAKKLFSQIPKRDFELNYIIINFATFHLSIAQDLLKERKLHKKVYSENWLALGIAHLEIAEKMVLGEYPSIFLPEGYCFRFALAHPTLARYFFNDPHLRKKIGKQDWVTLALKYDFIAPAFINGDTLLGKRSIITWVILGRKYGFVAKALLDNDAFSSQLNKNHWLLLGKTYEFIAFTVMDNPVLRELVTPDGWVNLAIAHRRIAEMIMLNKNWLWQLTSEHLMTLFWQHPTLIQKFREELQAHPMMTFERDKLMTHLDGFTAMMQTIQSTFQEIKHQNRLFQNQKDQKTSCLEEIKEEEEKEEKEKKIFFPSHS